MHQFIDLLFKIQAGLQMFFFRIYMSVIENSSTDKSATFKLQPESKAVSEWNKSAPPP